MERVEPVQAVKVIQICDECDGEMKATGFVYPTMPPMYAHDCMNCEATTTFNKSYPCIEYRECKK